MHFSGRIMIYKVQILFFLFLFYPLFGFWFLFGLLFSLVVGGFLTAQVAFSNWFFGWVFLTWHLKETIKKFLVAGTICFLHFTLKTWRAVNFVLCFFFFFFVSMLEIPVCEDFITRIITLFLLHFLSIYLKQDLFGYSTLCSYFALSFLVHITLDTHQCPSYFVTNEQANRPASFAFLTNSFQGSQVPASSDILSSQARQI